MTKTQQLDTADLERRVKDVYRHVAEHPEDQYHFEMGRPLAQRLGYPAELLDAIPPESLASFAGVGYFLDLLGDLTGNRVLDLGSGSGTDSFAAAHLVGPTGSVTGVDMPRNSSRRPSSCVPPRASRPFGSSRATSSSLPSRMASSTRSCPTA